MNSKEEILEILLLTWDSFSIKIRTSTSDFCSPGSNLALKKIQRILFEEGLIDENGFNKIFFRNKEKTNEACNECYA